MSVNSSHSAVGCAKIYQFPRRGRFASRGEAAVFGEAESTTVPGAASGGVAGIVFGSSWYHEEAVRDERAR